MLIMNGIYFHQATSPFKQDLGTKDIADECLLKKQHVAFHGEGSMRSVQHEIASLKERIEKLANEAQDISSTLQELLPETAESPEPDTEYHKFQPLWILFRCRYIKFCILFTSFVTGNQFVTKKEVYYAIKYSYALCQCQRK